MPTCLSMPRLDAVGKHEVKLKRPGETHGFKRSDPGFDVRLNPAFWICPLTLLALISSLQNNDIRICLTRKL